jgi:hypothetical protein
MAVNAFNRAWLVVKAPPLDLDSIKDEPHNWVKDTHSAMPFIGTSPKTYDRTGVASFIHPKTGGRTPIQWGVGRDKYNRANFYAQMIDGENIESLAHIGESADGLGRGRSVNSDGRMDVMMPLSANTFDNRREGRATALYDLAQALGLDFYPSDEQTKPAVGLWRKNSGGKRKNMKRKWRGLGERIEAGDEQ